jgi:membrane protease YdiL (CAAX protease family)
VSIDLTATPLPSSDSGSPRLRALGEMALCSSLPTQLAIGWTLRMAGWSPIDAEGNLQLGFVTALTLLDTVALVGLMVALMRARGERPSALWLGTRPVPREIVAGITHVPIVFSIGAVLLLSMRALTPELHNVDVNPFEALAGSSVTDAAILTLVAIVAGGVREELQRAFLLDRFERYLGPAWLGVMLLSTAFGLGHLVQGQDAAIATGAMGAFWAVVYLKRRSSVAPMVSHALFNALEVLLIATVRR